MKLFSNLQSFPSFSYSRLFGTGALIGPLVDGLHNQCLLEYHRAPIAIVLYQDAPLFCSSWFVPPLLGFAYVVLGGVMPRLMSRVIESATMRDDSLTTTTTTRQTINTDDKRIITFRNKAYLAVLTTALLIKLSEILETQSLFSPNMNVSILLCCALLQWAWLDRTIVALLVASITSIAGPWSELPFVAADVWHYTSPDVFPLSQIAILMTNDDYLASLGLNSITGPCYFAVTMDAIALGRWYESMSDSE